MAGATPTLQDVARLAGVSTATVSRCLNSPDRVQAHTRKRVSDAIQALDYTPNFAAQVMAAKRTATIGAVIPTMENAIFARGLQAFQDVLGERGYTLIVASSAYRPELEEQQIRKLIARGADGLLLIGEERSEAVYDFLRGRNVPAMAAWTYNDAPRLPCVGFDNFTAMRDLTAKVVEYGHRRIAYISGVIEGNDRARLRAEGWRSALRDAELDSSSIVEAPYDVEAGGDALEALIADAPWPTAVMCGNDVLAVGAMKRARERDIRVPDDLSITGFDDIEIARIIEPPLTTVHVPHREMGREAARALIDLIEGKGPCVSRELKTTLCLRASLKRAK